MVDVITIDPRPTTFGNKRVITGTVKADGVAANVDLSDYLSGIDGCMVMATGSSLRAAVTHSIDGTTVMLGALVDTVTYSFVAIGER